MSKNKALVSKVTSPPSYFFSYDVLRTSHRDGSPRGRANATTILLIVPSLPSSGSAARVFPLRWTSDRAEPELPYESGSSHLHTAVAALCRS